MIISGYTHRAMEHIRHLCEEIGGRGSCTANELRAAEYTADCLQSLGVPQVHLERFTGASSTYRPFALAFGSALLGVLALWVIGGQRVLAAVALLNGLAAWGMLAETDFTPNWLRWLLPVARSQNVIGVLPPAGEIRRHLVLCAHLDTHRTPIFYSSPIWHRLFNWLVSAAFASLVVNAALYGLGALLNWPEVRWPGLLTAAVQFLALLLCFQADLTPHSPGANDNASGVGVLLGLVERLQQQPLQHTEVWAVFTGCEEVGAYGISAFLDAHSAQLTPPVLYIVLDEVGVGQVEYLVRDGLIRKRDTHPYALQIARQAAAALPKVQTAEQVGLAYTDGTAITRRGLPALHINTVDRLAPSHWHQMSDGPETIELQALENAHCFAWEMLQQFDCRE